MLQTGYWYRNLQSLVIAFCWLNNQYLHKNKNMQVCSYRQCLRMRTCPSFVVPFQVFLHNKVLLMHLIWSYKAWHRHLKILKKVLFPLGYYLLKPRWFSSILLYVSFSKLIYIFILNSSSYSCNKRYLPIIKHLLSLFIVWRHNAIIRT